MMKWTVRFCVVLFCAASFAAGADNSSNNKNSNKNSGKSSSTPADHNVLHALRKFFTGKNSASHSSSTPVHRRKVIRRGAEEATPASSPESKASPGLTPSPTARRVVLPESSPAAKPTVSPTPVSGPESGASPRPNVVPLPTPAKGDETPKGD
jgi:hypothetical protein